MEEFTLSSLLLRIVAVIVLLSANAFFVAAEFALVASRRTRIEEMVRQGDRKAKTVQSALQDLYRQLAAAQLGITVASIMLGYVAEDTVAVLLHDWFTRLPFVANILARGAVVSITAVAVITALHVVIGEQAPKAWAISFPEATSRWVAGPLILFSWITRPVTNFLNWSSNQLVRLLGINGSAEDLESIHSPQEIVMLVKQTKESGQLDEQDVELIEGVFEFTEKNAREVMTPRTEVVGLPADRTIGDSVKQVAETGRSRYPIYRNSLDDIVGIVHVKQILGALQSSANQPVATLMQEPFFIPGTREVEDVLADMKRIKTHIAVVMDEFGGTAGIVTMEDLIEEIVGEIYDEYDDAEFTTDRGPSGITVSGDTDLEDLNKRFGFSLSEEDYQTIGGFLFGKVGHVPQVGDSVKVGDLVLEVLEMDGRRVGRVRIAAPPGHIDKMEEENKEP
jgi:CBS domain containing-hemolysin-like protein